MKRIMLKGLLVLAMAGCFAVPAVPLHAMQSNQQGTVAAPDGDGGYVPCVCACATVFGKKICVCICS